MCQLGIHIDSPVNYLQCWSGYIWRPLGLFDSSYGSMQINFTKLTQGSGFLACPVVQTVAEALGESRSRPNGVCSNGTGSGEGHNRDSSHWVEKVSWWKPFLPFTGFRCSHTSHTPTLMCECYCSKIQLKLSTRGVTGRATKPPPEEGF